MSKEDNFDSNRSLASAYLKKAEMLTGQYDPHNWRKNMHAAIKFISGQYQVDLQKIASILRSNNSNTYLIATPLTTTTGNNPDVTATLPYHHQELPFFLHLVQGEDMYHEYFMKVGFSAETLGIAREQNEKNLTQTGFLTIKPGTETARMVKGRNPIN